MIVKNEDIQNKYWVFYIENGHIASEVFRFLPDGQIGGYQNGNEKYWIIEDGKVCILDRNKIVTLKLQASYDENGSITLRGVHIPNPSVVLCLREQIGRPSFSQTKSIFKEEIETLGWTIGDHTYGSPEFIEIGMAQFSIGKYCSIAGGVQISLGNHRTDIFTSYPFAALRTFWHHVPGGISDHSSRGQVTIGNDVWIGASSFIGSGVRIGSGAVIGAHAVVTKDVPPYAVLVGNPGRVARYRFDEKTISDLLSLSWWDLPDDDVDSLLPFIMSNDIRALKSAVEKIIK